MPHNSAFYFGIVNRELTRYSFPTVLSFSFISQNTNVVDLSLEETLQGIIYFKACFAFKTDAL